MSHPFDCYASLTDLAALKEASSKQLRKSMRVNTLKCTADEFTKWSACKQWVIDPVAWCKEGFYIDRINRDEALGKDFFHILGYVYMQEAASMLPVALLDPKPGDAVLDMSAAPGSKTTQIAVALQGKGVLVANDVQEKRLWALLTNLQRAGVTNVIVTRKVGQWFAGNMTEMFDRVLCDAPCTAQGTIRKDTSALHYCSDDNIGKMAKLQRELLESAIHAAKVGGRIVYSTCTLTPQENEEVIASMLQKFPDQIVVLNPAEVLAKRRDEVLSQWTEQAVQDSFRTQEWLEKQKHSSQGESRMPLLRLWPQTYDTEGFFSAVLEKRAPTRARRIDKEVSMHHYDVFPKMRTKEIADRLEDWYGSSFIEENDVIISNRDQLSVLSADATHFRISLVPYSAGLPFGKYTDDGLPRLSHEIVTLRGHKAVKQILRLNDADIRSVLRGVNMTSIQTDLQDGDVLIALDNNALHRPMIFGRGMLKNGIVLNRLPREIVRMFT